MTLDNPAIVFLFCYPIPIITCYAVHRAFQQYQNRRPTVGRRK